MKKIAWLGAVCFPLVSYMQNPLFIPDTLSGNNFNLNVQSGTVEFYTGYNTPTFGVNGNFLAPTLFMWKDDTVTLNVINNLTASTTMHWHGFHVPPEDDGGPHQEIPPSTTWSPQFRVMNNAGTYWYHPHGHMQTELQVTKGLAGMIIIRDTEEAALNLPRTYGVDDFPIILQSRAFDILYQIAGFTHDDTVMMVNGTIDPYVQMPAQMVRLRLLDGSVDRSYMIGLSTNANFYHIATDGGLLEQPVLTNRLQISPGERNEIIIDLTGLEGQTVYLMSYASELATGVMGSGNVSMGPASLPGYDANPLNGNDFNLLEINVVAQTASPVTTVPATLTTITPIIEGTENRIRNFQFTPQMMGPTGMIEGPFLINGNSFDMMVNNDTTYLNHTEIWILDNQTGIAHPFHIHDVQFLVLDRNGVPAGPSESGWKDVVLVNRMETVRFITKFEDFHNATIPYMYHCHLLHHEDEGMMGAFLVLDSASLNIPDYANDLHINIFPSPASDFIQISMDGTKIPGTRYTIMDVSGQAIMTGIVQEQNEIISTTSLAEGLYFFTFQYDTYNITRKFLIVK